MSPRQCRLMFFVSLFLFALLPGIGHADVGYTGMAQPVEPAAASRKSLRLTVDAPAAPLALGDEATLTIVVTNDSAEPVENVLLYLAQEPGIEWVEPAGGPWLALGTLAAGETRTTVARLRVVGTHRSGQLRFTVGVTGDDAKPQRERVSLLVPRVEPETANVPAAGGEVSFARGRVRLAFPPGWNEQDAQLSFQLEELYKQKHKERGRLLLFTLTATAGDAPVGAFDTPVAIMLDVADLVAGDAAEPIPTVSTAPAIEESWAAVPSSFDPAAGTLSFSAEHFSAFQTTTDPQL